MAVHRLIAVASLVEEHRPQGMQASVVAACGLSSCGSQILSLGSIVVAHVLNCFVACGIFPDQGSNPCPPHWQADSTTELPENPLDLGI